MEVEIQISTPEHTRFHQHAFTGTAGQRIRLACVGIPTSVAELRGARVAEDGQSAVLCLDVPDGTAGHLDELLSYSSIDHDHGSLLLWLETRDPRHGLSILPTATAGRRPPPDRLHP